MTSTPDAPPAADPTEATARPPLLRRGVRTLLAGLLALFPLAMTGLIVFWLAGLAQRLLGPGSGFGRVLRGVGLAFVTSEAAAYLLGLGVTIVLVYLLGLLVESSLQTGWYSVMDRIMHRVPLVNSIYDASRRFARVLEPKGKSEMRDMSPVVCHFGGPGGSAILALLPSSERIPIGATDYLAVLVPSAPVPIGGFIVYVPAEWVEPAGFSVDGLINIYVSMGVTSPEYFGRGRRPPEEGPSS